MMDGGQRTCKGRCHFVDGRGRDLQVIQQAVVQAVNPAVNDNRLPTLPGIAHHRGVTCVAGLFEHVEFDQGINPVRLGQLLQKLQMGVSHILHMTQPVIDQTGALVVHGRTHAAAVAVPHHDNVLHAQYVNRVLNDR